MIIAFLDDSGSHDAHGLEPGSNVVAAAGFVMLGERRSDFEKDWLAALKNNGAREFHMRDFAHRRGEFEGWPPQRSDSLISELVAVVHAYALIYVGGLVLVRDYQSIIPVSLKAEIVHPLCMAFAACIEEFLRFLGQGEVRVREPGEKIQIIFDRKPGYYERLSRILQELKTRADRFDLIDGLIFESREAPEIQAADLIAYEFRKELDRMQYPNPTTRPRRKSMEALCARENIVAGYMDEERLAEFVTSFAIKP